MRGQANPEQKQPAEPQPDQQEQVDLEVPQPAVLQPEQEQLEAPALPFQSALEDLNSKLLVTLPVEQALEMTQREVSKLMDWEARAALLETTTSTRELARLRCLGREGAGDCLTALPNRALGLHLCRQEFVLAGCYHLGAQVYRTYGLCPARGCR